MNSQARPAASTIDLRRAVGMALSVPLLAGIFVLVLPDAATGADAAGRGPPPPVVVAADPGSLGAIPDGPGTPTCGNNGAPRNVTFSIPAFPGFQVADLDVDMTFGSPVHTFVGDITARLIDPSGTREHVLFGRAGATTATACGDSSDLTGPYLFSDLAVPPSGGWWQAATTAGATAPLASGDYRTTSSGGAGATNPMPATSMQPVFAGMTSDEAAGTWTLRIVDSGLADTGAVSAATLTLYLEVADLIFENGFEAPVL